jgi:LytS/YehU family sensor histidine kinase
MMALRAQMNPHFLFNCLNSINSFIMENDPDSASEYLTKFSRLIRLILNNSQPGPVTLASEIESIRLYVEMEAMRFNNRFSYKIDVDEDLEINTIEIPPLLIQPYVENAIWHGLMHRDSKGHLLIQFRQEDRYLCCIIEDDGIGRQQAKLLRSKSHGHPQPVVAHEFQRGGGRPGHARRAARWYQGNSESTDIDQ